MSGLLPNLPFAVPWALLRCPRCGDRGWFPTPTRFELALDEMEGLGENNAVPAVFWEHLKNASVEMDMKAKASRYMERGAG